MNSVGLIASIAQEQWRNRQYVDCLSSLDKLQEQLSTVEGAAAALAESKLRHNQALSRCSEPRALLATLATVNRGIEEESAAQRAAAGAAAVDDAAAAGAEGTPGAASGASEGSGGEAPASDASMLLYNQAVVLVDVQQFRQAELLLEGIFANIELMEEPLALCVCFLLLDLYTRTASVFDISAGASLNKVMEKAERVIAYLEKPHSFNQAGGAADGYGGSDGGGAADADGSKGGAASRAHVAQREVVEFRFRLQLFKAKLRLLQENVKGAKKEVKSALEIFQRELRGLIENDTGSGGDFGGGGGVTGTLDLGVRLPLPLRPGVVGMVTGGAASTSKNGVGSFAERQVCELNTPALCLKAQLEYLRRNYRKSLKLLSSCHKTRAGGLLAEGIYLNNIGCIHHQLGQHQCATAFLGKALAAYQASARQSAAIDDGAAPRSGVTATFGANAAAAASDSGAAAAGGGAQPVSAVGSFGELGGKKAGAGRRCFGLRGENNSAVVLSNIGVQLLLTGRPQLAWSCLLDASYALYGRPRLWVRAAECVVQAHEQALRAAAVRARALRDGGGGSGGGGAAAAAAAAAAKGHSWLSADPTAAAAAAKRPLEKSVLSAKGAGARRVLLDVGLTGAALASRVAWSHAH